MRLQITTKGHFVAFPEYKQNLGFMETPFRIPTNEIEEYIHAFQVNFNTYVTGKAEGDDSIYIGKKGMMIYMKGEYEGVCLFEHYRPIKTQEQLDELCEEMREIWRKDNGIEI